MIHFQQFSTFATSLDVARLETVPPAPASGVFASRRKTKKAPPAPTSAPPCAALWLGGTAAETLHPSQVLGVAADELDWVHEHTDDESDPAVIQARAAVEGWLSELSDVHQAAIIAQHCPVAWPEGFAGHEDDSFALVLCLLCSKSDRSRRFYTPGQLELRARRSLAIVVEEKGQAGVRRLIRQARWLYEDAVRAYAEVRGRVPSVIPTGSTGFASSVDELADEPSLEGVA
jgi:hypothetical protein